MQPDGEIQRQLGDLLRREHFDWADDVEEMLDSTADATESQSSNFTPKDPANLLQREYFDWAEGVEDEIDGNSAGQIDSYTDSAVDAPSAETVDAISGREIVEQEPEDDVSPPVEEQSRRAGSSGDQSSPLIVSSSSWTPSTDEEVSSPVYDFSQAEMDLSQEYAWRVYCTHQDYDIHHFNWLGSPVYEHSWTPPAVSLFYLLSDPKVPQPSDEYRLQSILYRATTYIDPILVYLERGLDGIRARGHELIRFATERTFKFYTPHGQWANDDYEKEGQTTIDDGDVYTYVSPSLATGNGFAEICPIRSRYKWAEARNERLAASQAFNANLYRSKATRDYKSSPLRQSMVPDDLISEMDCAVNKTDESHVCATDYENEAQDRVESLPTITSRKTSFRQHTCSSPGGSLKRRRSSFDLKSEADTFRDYHDREDGFASAENFDSCSFSTRIETHSSITITSSKSPTEKSAPNIEAEHVVESETDNLGIRAGNVDVEEKVDPKSSRDESPCELYNGNTYFVPEPSNRINIDFRDPFQPVGTTRHPDASTDHCNTNASTGTYAEFDPTVDFFANASDVQFTSIQSQTGRRRRSTLGDWKFKLKEQANVKHWRRDPEKPRSRLRKTPPASPPQSSSSNSSTSTPHSDTWGSLQSGDIPAASVENEVPEQHIIVESKFEQEYFSFPPPVFGVHSDVVNPSRNENDAFKKPNFRSRISAKGRSFCKKVKDGLGRSSNTDTRTRKSHSWSKFMAAGCSAMGPYPWYPV